MALTEHILGELISALKKLQGNRRVIRAMETWGKAPPSRKLLADIYVALKRRNAPRELLATVGSWTDTLSDEEVLKMLAGWNRGGKTFSHNGHSQWPHV